MESIVAARLGLWIADRLTLLQQSSSPHCNAKTQARGALVKHKVYVASTPEDHCGGEFSIDVEKLS